MAVISREDFLKREAEKQANRAKWNEGSKIGFFGLSDDGDEAIVRFCYNGVDEFDVLTTHQTQVDGKFRRVNCIRDFHEPTSACPMCAAGVSMQQKFYVKLIEYVRNDEGKIEGKPKIWERPTSFIETLDNVMNSWPQNEHPMNEYVYKITRNGKKGDMKTSYSVTPMSPSVYNKELYPYDASAFEGYNPVGHAVLDKKFDELVEMAGETKAPSVENVAPPRKVVYY